MEEKQLPWGLNAKTLAPGSMKNLTEDKLKAFNVGTMNALKSVSKKELEELKKKKDQEETEEVYKEFVESFEKGEKGLNRSWIKGGVVNPEKGTEKPSITKLYKPTSKLIEKKDVLTAMKVKEEKIEKPPPLKKKTITAPEKKKTNLELFKEELKVIQEERQERRKVRQDLGLIPSDPTLGISGSGGSGGGSILGKDIFLQDDEPIAAGISMGIMPTADEMKLGSFTYDNDTQTTNLYLGNLNPKMTEMQICDIFGKYGPLASVKVMWPRTDEEKARGRNCGFVAYMNRKDAERAYNNLQGKEIQEFEMKLGWGKSVPIPPHPVYIPPALSELTLPPPPSGQPFNAQPIKKRQNNSGNNSSENSVDDEKSLANFVVKVVIPTEKMLLCIIHRMVEFVVREGPMFEAMIMNREIQNPMFRFLFENQSPAHIYYRWKLFSILQGDSPYSWRSDDFYMFEGGSVWRPPKMNPFTQGMPDELVVDVPLKSSSNDNHKMSTAESSAFEDAKKSTLSDGQRDKLEDMLRDLTPERSKVADCMVWCLNHAENAEEIVDCIAESMSILETPIPKKTARLFLISDLLHNSSARVAHASYFRRHFEQKLPDIFKDIHDAHEKIDARLKAEQFKQKVMSCFRAWEDWAVYTGDFLIKLQNIFLGLVLPKGPKVKPEEDQDDLDNDVDGIPLDELDGVPIETNKLAGYDSSGGDDDDFATKSLLAYVSGSSGDVPTAGGCGSSTVDEAKSVKKPAFIPSKWETVDEAALEAQAMTVSKWDTLERQSSKNSSSATAQGPSSSSSSKPFNEQLKECYSDDDDDDEDGERANYDDDDDIDGVPLDDNPQDVGDKNESESGSKKRRHHRRRHHHSSSSSNNKNVKSSSSSSSPSSSSSSLDRIDVKKLSESSEMSEAKRNKLREIELKVLKYQDELETSGSGGRSSRSSGRSVAQKVEEYRQRLLKKEFENDEIYKRSFSDSSSKNNNNKNQKPDNNNDDDNKTSSNSSGGKSKDRDSRDDKKRDREDDKKRGSRESNDSKRRDKDAGSASTTATTSKSLSSSKKSRSDEKYEKDSASQSPPVYSSSSSTSLKKDNSSPKRDDRKKHKRRSPKRSHSRSPKRRRSKSMSKSPGRHKSKKSRH